MSHVAVGQPAPGFRLPSAQGPDVALDDYRGRKNVIVWFSKGMACVFCRQHMSQLARLYPELVKRDTEVLEITPTKVARGRFYASKYRLPFPYLCDGDDAVRRAWHLDIRSHGLLWYASTLKKALATPKPDNDFSKDPPAVPEMGMALRDEDTGFFIVDRGGIIRYAHGGPYMTVDGPTVVARPLPNADEVLSQLARLAA
jgi:peroxiredoxin